MSKDPTPQPRRRASATDEMPTHIGIYEVRSLLGEGGMGEVFLAWDGRLERHVAIKRVHRNRVATPGLQDRFLREARSVAALDHAAVVKVHDVLYEGGRACLVMEFVEGETLAEILERDGPMPVERVVDAALQIVAGLAEAHAKGLIHRDLKTENVMVRADGRIKILDFGVVLSPEASQLTDPGFLIGTARAMSPEQARGEPLTAASDLFSLGVLLFEMVSNVSPFESTGQVDTLMRVVTEPAPPLRRHVPNVPPALERLVSRLLEKDPRWRPESARQVRAELEALSPGTPGAGRETGNDLETRAGHASGPEAEPPGRSDAGNPPLDRPVLRVLLRILPGADTTSQALRDTLDTESLLRFGAVFGWDCRRRHRGLLLVFERAGDAVSFALEEQRRVASGAASSVGEGTMRIGIQLGEVRFRREGDSTEVVGEAVQGSEALASLASEGQTLLGRAAFDLARNSLEPTVETGEEVQWLAHGSYDLGIDVGLDSAAREVFEVGLSSLAPLRAPSGSSAASRKLSGVDTIEGWRPAAGLRVPQRSHWLLQRRTGRGGTGEVWLARHGKTGDARVFKFCYEASRLRSLQREITLFRVLKDELGVREDIARVIDWNFDAPPYFIESEYTSGGDLTTWAEVQGGIAVVPMEVRLRIVAQVARALAAAHSVGVLHKDVKPSNILIATEPDGEVHARLADFGVGTLTEHERLDRADITAMGLTEGTGSGSNSSLAGTRLYWAPEVLEGKAASPQTDIFALGVTLFQVVVGDLRRALAPGWWREVDDELLREDIADSVDGSPDRRLADAADLAERLEALQRRRAEILEQSEQTRLRQVAEAKARQAERALGEMRRRRNLVSAALFVLLIFSLTVFYQNRRVAKEAEAANRVARSLESLFHSVSPWEGATRDFTVLELLEHGEQHLETQLVADPRVRARLLTVLGRVRCEYGDYDSAEDLLNRALVLQERLFPEGHPEQAESLAALGRVNMLRGDTDEARGFLADALEIRRRYPAGPDMAVLLEEIALTSEFAGRLKEAKAYAEEALELRRLLAPDAVAPQAFTIGHLAWIHRLEGDLATAERLSAESMALHDESRPVVRPLRALSLISAAAVDADLGRAGDAVPKIEGALRTFRLVFGKRHFLVGAGLNQQASAHLRLGELDRAEALYSEALDLFRSIFAGRNHFHLAGSHVGLGQVYQAQGRMEAAEEHLRQGLAMYRQAFHAEHFRIGFVETDLASLLAAEGRLNEAEALVRHALETLPRTLHGDHWRIVYARAVLGDLLLRQGRPDEARPHLLAARQSLQRWNGGWDTPTDLVEAAWGRLDGLP